MGTISFSIMAIVAKRKISALPVAYKKTGFNAMADQLHLLQDEYCLYEEIFLLRRYPFFSLNNFNFISGEVVELIDPLINFGFHGGGVFARFFGNGDG